ncbi:MAG: Hpt domain-containing protein [Campylobacterales bacterium]
MYYIVNINKQIIAADQSFLDKLGLEDITQIYHKIAQGDISINYEKDILKLITSSLEEEYKITQTPLKSLVGELYIVLLEKVEALEKATYQDNDDEILHNLFDSDDEGLVLEENIEQEDVSNGDSVELEGNEDNDEILLDSDNFLLEDEDNEDNQSTKEDKLADNEVTNDDEIFDLLLTSDDNAPLISLGEEDISELSISNKEPIILDIEKLSQTIGISVEDYQSFLDEYKETSFNLQEDIRNSNVEKRTSAIQTLQHLSDVLHIPVINEILDRLSKGFDNKLVDELYDAISRIITGKQDDSELADDIKVTEPIDEKTIDEKTKTPIKEDDSSNQVEEGTVVTGKHKIDLSDVKPIHFDFSMEQAANELSLPVDLIDEFVHDFIEQAHEETENMLTAYDEGDLDRVNKLGHLLKGTSSNLRITPLADTLYKIQFCENLDELEPLIKDYWGHFLAFEKQIKMRTN